MNEVLAGAAIALLLLFVLVAVAIAAIELVPYLLDLRATRRAEATPHSTTPGRHRR